MRQKLSCVEKLKVKKKMEMRVYVDPELCSGCGTCVDICTEAFELELNEKGVAAVKLDEVPAKPQDACKEAVYSCPTEAISVA